MPEFANGGIIYVGSGPLEDHGPYFLQREEPILTAEQRKILGEKLDRINQLNVASQRRELDYLWDARD